MLLNAFVERSKFPPLARAAAPRICRARDGTKCDGAFECLCRVEPGTACAFAPLMNAVALMMKRGHLGSVAFGLRVFESVLPDMTPARFDVLFAIRRAFGENTIATDVPQAKWVEQGFLCGVLGLHHSTISKMVSRLVKLGWVFRLKSEKDRRKSIVRLTDKGLQQIDAAIRFNRKFRPHQVHLEAVFARLNKHPTKAMKELHDMLEHVAHSYGDYSCLRYEIGRTHEPPKPLLAKLAMSTHRGLGPACIEAGLAAA